MPHPAYTIWGVFWGSFCSVSTDLPRYPSVAILAWTDRKEKQKQMLEGYFCCDPFSCVFPAVRLGKAEVGSSILPGSTISAPEINELDIPFGGAS